MCNRKLYKIFIRKTKNTNLLERHNCDKIILNIILKQWDLKVDIEDEEFDYGPNLCKHKGNGVK
jgi:hypothetical protein